MNEFMGASKRILALCLLIVVISSLWMYLFTIGVPFFWESISMFNHAKEEVVPLLKQRTTPSIFFEVNYSTRPWNRVLWCIQGKVCGTSLDDIWKHRILKAIVFGLVSAMVFCIITLLSGYKFGLLGSLLYGACPEVWFSIVDPVVDHIYMHLITLSGILIFLIYFLKYRELNIFARISLACVIFILTLTSIFIKQEARYLFPLFLVSIAFALKTEIFKSSYKGLLFLILGLGIICFPFLGIIRNLFTGVWHPLFLVPASGNHLGVSGMLYKAASNFKNIIPILGRYNLLFIAISFVVIAIKHFRWKRGDASRKDKFSLIFVSCWFFGVLASNFLIDGWNYAPRDYQSIHFDIVYAPYVIFITVLFYHLGLSLKGKAKNIILFFCLALLMMNFLVNVNRLNQNRGGWGGYWIAWGAMSGYIDKHFDSAAVVTAPTTENPAYFSKPGNAILFGDFYDKKYMRDLSLKYKKVFVALRQAPLDPIPGSPFVFVKRFSGETDTLYDKFKAAIGRRSAENIVLLEYEG